MRRRTQVKIMIQKFSKSLVDVLIKYNAVDSSLMDIYVYGYEVIISGIFDLLITIIIGIISGELINAISFLIIFVTVRVYTGGYHANTYIKCKIVFITILICVLTLSKFYFDIFTLLFIDLFFVAIVFLTAPIENEKKPFSDDKMRQYSTISRIISLCWSAFALLIFSYNSTLTVTIISTELFIGLLLAYGKVKEVKQDERQ